MERTGVYRRRRTVLVILCVVALVVSSCNFPIRRNPALAPTNTLGVWLRKLPPHRSMFIGSSGATIATMETVTPVGLSPTESGAQELSSGCPSIFRENYEGLVVYVGEFSSINPPTQEWIVYDLSTPGKPPGLPAACSQGALCAVTNGVDVYDDDAEDLLYTPELDFTGYPPPIILTFDLAYDLEPTYDGMRIIVSPDLGESWYMATPQGGYPPAKPPYGDYRTSNVSAFDDSPGYSGDSGGWIPAVVDLTPMIAISPRWTIAFEFASDSSVGMAGVAVDNIRVGPACPATATTPLTYTPTLSPTLTPTRTRTPMIIPTTEVPPPPRPTATLCPPTHKC